MSLNTIFFKGDEPKLQMTAGQMLLAGFNGLFTKLESEVEAVLGAVQHVDPSFDDGVSVFNEIKELQVCIKSINSSWEQQPRDKMG